MENHAGLAEQAMLVLLAPSVIPCPYCVEAASFKAMAPRANGKWFLCASCDHVVIPDNPDFVCRCSRCVQLERLERSSNLLGVGTAPAYLRAL